MTHSGPVRQSIAVSKIAFDIHAKRYAPTKIAVVLEVGREAGLAEFELFEGTDLDARAVEDVATNISIAQYMTAARNLVRLYSGDDVGIQMGKRLNISQYGIYGYAVLCSGSLRQACNITARYAPLGTPIFLPSIREQHGMATWTFTPIEGVQVSDLGGNLYRCLMEAQLLLIAGGIRELMGAECVPLRARMAMPRSQGSDQLEAALGCTIAYDQTLNELEYDDHWMDLSPRLASQTISARVCQTLASQLDEFKSAHGFSHRVYLELTREPGHFPSMDAIATMLNMTGRTLRRRLEAEGTSYQDLLDRVRRTMAEDYLNSTQLSTDDIAPILGFCDAASFRNAFRRWTGMTPSQFRVLN